MSVCFYLRMGNNAATIDDPKPMNSRTARYLLIGFGWLCIAIGLVGIVVPGLPTTVFLLVAAWAFSRSSPRFQEWLVEHPRLGPPVQAWRERGAIPVKAKVLAVIMMSLSLAIIISYGSGSWVFPAAVGVIMAGAAAYVISRPNA
jgi:uncharacterized protein